MTRKKFLDELNHRLKRLPSQERLEAIKYYEEYFDEAGPENEQKIIAELRSPAHIATKIISEYADKEVNLAKKSPKTGVRALWFTLLGVLAAPVAIPLTIAFALIIVGLCIGLLGLILGLLVAGSALVIVALGLLFVQPASAILIIGLILIAIGITRLLYDAVTWIIKSISQFVRSV